MTETFNEKLNIANDKLLSLLEFDKIRNGVAECATSEFSRSLIKTQVPSFDRREIEHMLTLTAEACEMLNKYNLNPVEAFDDVAPLLEKAEKEAILLPGELVRIARVLRCAKIAKSTLDNAPDDIAELKKIFEFCAIDQILMKNIFDWVVGENEIADTASDKLFGLRRKKISLQAKLREKLLSYTRNNDFSKYLQDNIVTVRDGRYVLPVRAECRSGVQGVVHDRSATGSTIFVEPFAVVEFNNEMRIVVAEEQEEIERILSELSRRVALSSDDILLCQTMCTMLDIVFSKAKFSNKISGIIPKFNDKFSINLVGARHPLIRKDKVVPVDVRLGDEYKILLITGPNTGGKTVCMKTVGLFCLMAYFGLFLPCANAEICYFSGIYCNLGDEQSLENELSTFSSHIKNIADILQNCDSNSLILLDEVGGGTSPEEGAALAIGIVKEIERKCACAILTTHYDKLKEYALVTNCVENACMQFDENTLAPTYKLIIGMPGTSNALKIARKLGLPQQVVLDAENALDEKYVTFEKLLQSAEKIKNDSMRELDETLKIKSDLVRLQSETAAQKAKLDATYDKIKQNAAVETKRLVSAAVEKANELIEQVKTEMKHADEASLLRMKQMRRNLEDIEYSLRDDDLCVPCLPIEIENIVSGAHVIIKTIGSEGVVFSVNTKRKQALVQSGAAKLNVDFADLGKPPHAKKKEKRPDKQKVLSGEKASSGFSEREVILLGKTISEAIEIIEPLIIAMNSENDAKILRIVHGKGTGALGKGIQAYLKTSPLVSEFRFGRYGEGDNGVTIATIK